MWFEKGEMSIRHYCQLYLKVSHVVKTKKAKVDSHEKYSYYIDNHHVIFAKQTSIANLSIKKMGI